MYEEGKTVFRKLTPIDDADLSVYADAFEFAFSDNDIKNIAITGAYGIGKSSIVKSFEKSSLGLEHNFLYVSLAEFKSSKSRDEQKGKKLNGTWQQDGLDGTKQDKKKNVSGTAKENELEARIINQLIYQIDETKIPKSRFKHKKNDNNKEKQVFFVQVLVAIIAILFILFYGKISKYLLIPILGAKFHAEYCLLSATIILILIGGHWLYEIIVEGLLSNIGIQKLTLYGNSIELFADKEDSLFDKYMGEIIYALKNSGYDVVVFEDIDRYDDINIFTRLREINYLLNTPDNVECEKDTPIRFLYLIKDDIFTKTDRTKFFDYIIPIVPIMANVNSFYIFKRNLKDSKYHEKLDEDVIRGISVFVSEKRLLDNICNEFEIYAKSLDGLGIDYNNLLGMIAYKCFYPEDYCGLLNGNGFVADLFSNVENLRKIIEKNSSYDSNQVEKMMMVEILQENNSNRALKSTIDKIKEQHPDVTNVEHYGLLQFLLLEGLISENYSDYITVFQNEDLTKGDYAYIAGLYTGKCQDDYKFDNVEKVVDEISMVRFARKEILNHNILHFLLSSEKHIGKLESMISTIVENKSVSFCEEFFEAYKDDRKSFVIRLNECSTDFWHDSEESRDNSIYEEVVLEILQTEDKNIIEKINLDDRLTEYISKNGVHRFESVYAPERLFDSLVYLKVKFEDFTAGNNYVLERFCKEIIDNSLYKPTLGNLMAVLRTIMNDAFVSSNNIIESIEKCGNQTIKDYFQENISAIVDEIIEKQFKLQLSGDATKFLLDTVNDGGCEDSQINEITKLLTNKVDCLDIYEDETIIESLLLNGKVQALIKNIIYCFYIIDDNNMPNAIDDLINDCNDYSMSNDEMIKYYKSLDVNDEDDSVIQEELSKIITYAIKTVSA